MYPSLKRRAKAPKNMVAQKESNISYKSTINFWGSNCSFQGGYLMYHAVLAHVLPIGNRNGAWFFRTIQPFSFDHPNDPNVWDIQTRKFAKVKPQITPAAPATCVLRWWSSALFSGSAIWYVTRKVAKYVSGPGRDGGNLSEPWADVFLQLLIPKKCMWSRPTSGGWWRQIDWLDPQSLKEYWPHFDESQDLNVDISRTDKHHWKESEKSSQEVSYLLMYSTLWRKPPRWQLLVDQLLIVRWFGLQFVSLIEVNA